jgi:hypothetical protein
MPSSNPRDRALIARIASHVSWSNTPDPAARTAPAREASLARFEDPTIADPVERARRAEHARKAYFLGLALKSAEARRNKAAARGLRDLADAIESSGAA